MIQDMRDEEIQAVNGGGENGGFWEWLLGGKRPIDGGDEPTEPTGSAAS